MEHEEGANDESLVTLHWKAPLVYIAGWAFTLNSFVLPAVVLVRFHYDFAPVVAKSALVNAFQITTVLSLFISLLVLLFDTSSNPDIQERMLCVKLTTGRFLLWPGNAFGAVYYAAYGIWWLTRKLLSLTSPAP